MPQVIVIAEGDGFTVADVLCTGGCAGFDAAEVEGDHLLVAARRGAFLRRERGTEILVDGTVAGRTEGAGAPRFMIREDLRPPGGEKPSR